ncbi:fumarylacetoacetate hydrolase family protein [Rhizobium oryzihabitans]|jgi:fumarylpyruvate hydrolase|uniref:Fumarylacetoacetate hydrolase family protein n=2 Tax=Rhizobium TaxID=379 RepID=A0A7L5BEB1_9HYPH|nr:fumarylacetoacetate hydrolase family protein [Rhizobium oryzihabitans]MCW0979470.1 fumarylacetoacetate hydrolase family protein [Agrobacterium sp. BT-220-3]QCM04819.1 fumarylacetoacetate hydrolase family protein [Agrobacterium tumefaciens]CUX16983.1 putative Fumarylacetoacetate hydrolase family protein [Agrobacterium genomosp. 5 str. CFBP 6626]HBT66946.1 FAA hydrolase family protein [Agrobacterium sp.]QIB37172.1 fumarylacetoacetate hydrolase family protein [Rhizobium oryzihabitans]
MATTVIPAPKPVLLPVEGTGDTFPVRRVYCVGRNYADHAIEMGHDPSREPPFYFQKNPDNLLPAGQDFPYPSLSSNVHYEVECVVVLKSGGADIPASEALSHVWGYAVGIDMTRRDLQDGLKKMGRSWEGAKAFEYSAPVSAIVPAEKIGHPATGAIWLDVNGERKQTGDLAQMIWKVPEVIAELSKLFTLAAGDVIMTGTPAGVGPIVRGDRIECGVEGVGTLSVTVA